MLQNNSILKTKIDQLWDKFWSGGISNPLTAIEQISYLLFMRQIDKIDLDKMAAAEFTGDRYISKFSGEYTLPGIEDPVEKETLRWSKFKVLPAEKMLSHVRDKVFPFLRDLSGTTSPFTKHMKNAVFIIEKPGLLVEAVKKIDEIFVEIEADAQQGGQAFQDIQGDVYEMLLNEIAQAGKNGQFRTPRHIIKLMVELADPKFGQRIADPACGTGGFLLGAYQYIVTQLDKTRNTLEPDEDGFIRSSVISSLTENVRETLEKCLYGYDIDVTMVRLGLMNLMMHGIDNPNIDYMDTLSKAYNEDGFYDIVLANPPFTGSIDKSGINESLRVKTAKTELLFIERIFNMLRIGGTAALIVPQGVLSGSSNAFVETRKKLIEQAELKAVISIPSGVFKPYAGVSTAILLFTKGGETHQTWFYNMRSDGYTLDDKRSKLSGYGDLQDIMTRYHLRSVEGDIDRSGNYFFVPKHEIIENKYDFRMSQYQDDIYEEISGDAPELILRKLCLIEDEINDKLQKMRVYIHEK